MFKLMRFDGRQWILVFQDRDEGTVEAERDELIEFGGIPAEKLRIFDPTAA
jgi:hypothetical protein